MAKISVIVPVYKVEANLKQCIDSILSQTFIDFELILVNDGSPDACPIICDQYAERDMRVHVLHQNNKGLSAARNSGIDWAFKFGTSNWLTFIDSDDWVHKDYLIALYKNAVSTESDCVVIGYIESTSRFNILSDTAEACNAFKVSPDDFFGRIYNFENFKLPVNIAWGKLYRKELFSNIRFPVGKINEDRFMMHKILFSCNSISIIPQPMYYYFLSSDSITRSRWSPRELDDIEAIRNQLVFFRLHGAKHALKSTIKDYYRVTLRQLHRIDAMNNSEFNQYKRQTQKELFHCCVKYKKELKLTREETKHVLYALFPLIKRLVKLMRRSD